ncbi:hypothetical protein AAY473_032180 [Plecturocebus cupreus]
MAGLAKHLLNSISSESELLALDRLDALRSRDCLRAGSSSWLEYSNTILAHCSLDLPGSGNLSLPSRPCLVWLIFNFFVKTRSHYVAQAGLKLLVSSDLPALASQSAGIIAYCASQNGLKKTAFGRARWLTPVIPALREAEVLIHKGFATLARLVLKLWTSIDPPTLASQSAGIRGMSHRASPNFLETRFCHVGHAGLELLTSGDPPALASQSAGITGVSHRAWPTICFCKKNLLENSRLIVDV